MIKYIIGDTMEVIILASGSKGNATLIKSGESLILVDIGISYLSFNRKLKELNIKAKDISNLLITHEHSDHIKGLKTFLTRNPNINVIITKGTFNSLSNDISSKINNILIINQQETFQIADIKVKSYPLSHDAKEPVGYIIDSNNKRVVLATDTGYIDQRIHEYLIDADLYILEANYCPVLLMESKRPFYLKKRIMSEKGHLSNQDACWLVNELSKNKESVIWAVAHISEDCNSIDAINQAISDYLIEKDKFDIVLTSQEDVRVINL